MTLPAIPSRSYLEDPDFLNSGHKLAARLAATEFVPQALKGRPEAVLACVLTGHELGLQPMQALQSIHIIQGRPTLSAELMRAIVHSAGHTIRIIEKTDSRVVVEGQRADDPGHTLRIEWTIDTATRAGLTSKDMWRKYPRQMLTARAVSELCRDMFADVLKGLSYTAEEVEHIGDITPEPAPPPDTPGGMAPGISDDDPIDRRTVTALVIRIGETLDPADKLRHRIVDEWTGGRTQSTKDITHGEARALFDALDELDGWDGETDLTGDASFVDEIHAAWHAEHTQGDTVDNPIDAEIVDDDGAQVEGTPAEAGGEAGGTAGSGPEPTTQGPALDHDGAEPFDLTGAEPVDQRPPVGGHATTPAGADAIQALRNRLNDLPSRLRGVARSCMTDRGVDPAGWVDWTVSDTIAVADIVTELEDAQTAGPDNEPPEDAGGHQHGTEPPTSDGAPADIGGGRSDTAPAEPPDPTAAAMRGALRAMADAAGVDLGKTHVTQRMASKIAAATGRDSASVMADARAGLS